MQDMILAVATNCHDSMRFSLSSRSTNTPRLARVTLFIKLSLAA